MGQIAGRLEAIAAAGQNGQRQAEMAFTGYRLAKCEVNCRLSLYPCDCSKSLTRKYYTTAD